MPKYRCFANRDDGVAFLGQITRDFHFPPKRRQVLHGFDSAAHAEAYLSSAMFSDDVVIGLKPYLNAAPDIRIYTVA